MQQVLFHIPLKTLGENLPNIPIYGYGAMLFLAFVFSVWLAARLAVREGINPQHVQDLAIWILLGGIAGARITYMIQYGVPIWHFFRIWEGGLVFYGSAIGGLVGYGLAYFFFLRKQRISTLKMVDAIAPCAALGLCLGRVGCLLNGCCYGNVACPNYPGVSFPLSAQPRIEMVRRGYQTAAGFTLVAHRSKRVGAVENGSPAARAGLQQGDEILQVNGMDVAGNAEIGYAFKGDIWPRGQNDLALEVKHANGRKELLTFSPRSIPLHPTQVYETISMGLLVFLLLAFYPFKRRDGAVMVLFMLAYAVHRFLDEMLRTDTDPVFLNMTLSENISIVVFAAGLLLGAWIMLRRSRTAGSPAT